jgi:hypothetical protein
MAQTTLPRSELKQALGIEGLLPGSFHQLSQQRRL